MCPADPPTGPPPPRRRRSLGRGGATGWPRLGQGADREGREPRPEEPEPRPATTGTAGSRPRTAEAPEPVRPAAARSRPPQDEAARNRTPEVEPRGNEPRGSEPREEAAPECDTPDDETPRDEAPAAPDGRFTLRLANFEGPFDLLLQLISRHKLDVTEVALSQVTDEFMAHIRAMGGDWDLDQTTEFLVVAATLLDLKAARLLPAAEIEDEADLALLEARDLLFARLLQYRAYKRVADIFSARLDQEARRYPRTVSLEPHHAALLPEVVIRIGAEGFARLAVKAMQPRPEPAVYVEHIHAPLVSVREQAEVVVARLRDVGQADFAELVADAQDTLTVVARFLALLELYREKAVALDQEDALGPLTVRWTGTEDGTAPTVTDEFDQEHRPQEQKQEETG
ncbi:segregation and condensation protein A [Streptomyces sp. NPDC007088]|uniref:segregation and condensation protein A n=1 Tax=Streptomyces sp. NPDC007088 TaxID=3364773 RepID=UPI003673FDDD